MLKPFPIHKVPRPFFRLSVALIIVLCVNCSKDDHGISGKIPNPTLTTLDQKSVKLFDYPKDFTLLVFWATWCQPCIMEIPSLVMLEAKYSKQNFQVLAINVDDPKGGLVRKLVADYNINYQILLGEEKLLNQFGGIVALPTSLLINKDGQIIEKFEGLVPEYILDAKIKKYLPPPA